MLTDPPRSHPALHITLSLHPDAATATLTGELDLATFAHLRKVLDQLGLDGYRHITLDMSGLDFLAARGISVIAQTDHDCTRRGGSLTLTNPDPRVRRVLTLTDHHHLIADGQRHPGSTGDGVIRERRNEAPPAP